MDPLQQITIKSPKLDKCESVITLFRMDDGYLVSILIIYDGVHREHDWLFDEYTEAWKTYLEEVNLYANFTAIMNL